MKKLFLFSTKFGYFLTEIPPIILLIISIKYNNYVDSATKLYPLILAISGVIVFIGLYFWRGVFLSYDQLRCVGLFSSKESSVINKDKTLHISILPKGKIRIELYGENDDFETYAWLKNDNSEINLFRAKALGGISTVRKILSYYGAETDDIERAISEDSFSSEYEKINFSSSTENNTKTFKIYFKETL